MAREDDPILKSKDVQRRQPPSSRSKLSLSDLRADESIALARSQKKVQRKTYCASSYLSKSRAPPKRARQVTRMLTMCLEASEESRTLESDLVRKHGFTKHSRPLVSTTRHRDAKAHERAKARARQPRLERGKSAPLMRPRTAPPRTSKEMGGDYASFITPTASLSRGFDASSKSLQQSRYPLSTRAGVSVRPALENQTIEDISFRGPPLCLKCGRLADKEMDRYRNVRAVGFKAIFDRAHQRYVHMTNDANIRHVFASWHSYARLEVFKRRQATKLFALKNEMRLRAAVSCWAGETRRRAINRLRSALRAAEEASDGISNVSLEDDENDLSKDLIQDDHEGKSASES